MVLYDSPEASVELMFYTGFHDSSALLKHELAYCLGQMKNPASLPVLESVLKNTSEDAMVRHEVRCPYNGKVLH
jgi:deoxyhypusine monooxygenase